MRNMEKMEIAQLILEIIIILLGYTLPFLKATFLNMENS